MRFGILAHPAGHSLSPVMFGAAFEAVGLDDYSYEVFDVEPADLEKFMREREFDGLSVSLPHKETVIEYLDSVSEDAKKIGAVNTVSNDDGQLIGNNTDWIGATQALKDVVGALRGLRVIVLGAGGAARAITYGLLREKAEVVVLNRNLDEAQGLEKDFGVEIGLLDSAVGRECDILVQATSVWITAGLDVKIVPSEFVRELGANDGVVMDIVYKPLMTPLLEEAQTAGCRVVTGEKMLLNQAMKQFEIWTGKTAPKHIMQGTLESAIT